MNNIDENYINIWIDEKINHYIKYISKLKQSFKLPINSIINILEGTNNNIYITGIGKCGHICKKSVSTWQSMGISCHYLNLPDLFHGDFGILKENDIIIYISNSGNTSELINCVSYIKNNFNILQIGLTINKINQLSNYVNYSFTISDNIIEIDNINMAPTLSSVIFMMFLDMLGIYIAEKNNVTIEKFQLYHPGGELGKKSRNIIDYVVIVASGSGSRLYSLTKYIPKILVNLNNKPYIESLIEYWSQYSKNIIIISNSKYNDLINFYISKYNNVKVINFDDLTGTADTINKSLTKEYYGKNILFTWCDILPICDIDIKKLKNNTIFTFGNECRYKAFDDKIGKDDNGNIIGIYYIKNFSGINNYQMGQDICDVFINNFGKFNTYDLNSLIDIGDIEKLKRNSIENNFKTRFFNKIILDNNKIIKESIIEQGNEIIKKEIMWYQAINNEFKFVPHFDKINDTKFMLEYVDGQPLYKVFCNLNKEDKIKCLSNIYKKLNLLHHDKIIIGKHLKEDDIMIESYNKIITRMEKIEPILWYFKNISKVNGVDTSQLYVDEILNEMKDILISNLSEEYSRIIGDCQFSNILFKNDDLFFIDPRGYFGNTLIYGEKEYDFAKVLYALTGYDYFNNNDLFSIEIIDNEIIFDVPNYMNDDLPIVINEKIKAWLIVIWFGLAQYNSNNVIKCIASYYNAFYWYIKLFKERQILTINNEQ